MVVRHRPPQLARSPVQEQESANLSILGLALIGLGEWYIERRDDMKQTKWQRLATIGLCSSLVINAFSGVTAVGNNHD